MRGPPAGSRRTAMGDALRRIARTALLCGTLGLLLYFVLAAIVEQPLAVAWLPLLFGLAAAPFLLFLTAQDVASAWRSGEFPARGAVVLRSREPVWFWSMMVWQTAACLLLAGLIVYLIIFLGKLVEWDF